MNSVEKKEEQIIPKKIFQTWHTKDLPPKMSENIEYIKKIHPDFEHYLFDSEDCRIFIKHYFDSSVINAFDILIPQAFKADLWRYCVLYVNGGVYMDVKLKTTENFTLHQFLEKEYFVRDLPHLNICGIYNGILICKPKNPLFLQAINKIVENVNNKFYGNLSLEVTGPHLLVHFFESKQVENFDLSLQVNDLKNHEIIYNGNIIFEGYIEYRQEQSVHQNNLHYDELWWNRKIYNS